MRSLVASPPVLPDISREQVVRVSGCLFYLLIPYWSIFFIPNFKRIATSSELWGSAASGQIGKYPAKLYNSNNVLIYQEDRGANNSGKLPSGGVLYSATLASSMSAVVANPITIYGGAVVSQVGQSGDLYNYYWTSYSIGTDGQWSNSVNWHNLYLDSYIPLRHKSIYDPCPYGYRIPSNGTYNQFANTRWTSSSYVGGVNWNLNEAISWFAALGMRADNSGSLSWAGEWASYLTSQIGQVSGAYAFEVNYNGGLRFNRSDIPLNRAVPVRCIEECELLPDATEVSAELKLEIAKIIKQKFLS